MAGSDEIRRGNTEMTNSILTVHVADSIERITHCVDYDASADFAAFLLGRYASLRSAAAACAASDMTVAGLDARVALVIADHRNPVGVHR